MKPIGIRIIGGRWHPDASPATGHFDPILSSRPVAEGPALLLVMSAPISREDAPALAEILAREIIELLATAPVAAKRLDA